MIRNALRKVIGFGLALVIAGVLVLPGPVVSYDVDDTVAPFQIMPPAGEPE